MRVKLCRYLSSYDPIRKQETPKPFFINKYQSCRGLNTSLLLRAFPSLCKTTMGSHTWDFLIARSPKAPSKIYSPLSPKEDLILSQATNAFYMLWCNVGGSQLNQICTSAGRANSVNCTEWVIRDLNSFSLNSDNQI